MGLYSDFFTVLYCFFDIQKMLCYTEYITEKAVIYKKNRKGVIL